MEISSSPWSFIWLNYWTTLSPFSSRRSLSPDLSSVLGTAFCLKTNNIKLKLLNLYNWDDEASNSSQSFVIILSRKMKFLKKSMNIVDLLAIAPFYISLLLGKDFWYKRENIKIFLEGLEEFEVVGKTGKIIRLIRIMRILRIFKLVRHFAGLQSLLITLQQVENSLPPGAYILLDCHIWGLQRARSPVGPHSGGHPCL